MGLTPVGLSVTGLNPTSSTISTDRASSTGVSWPIAGPSCTEDARRYTAFTSRRSAALAAVMGGHHHLQDGGGESGGNHEHVEVEATEHGSPRRGVSGAFVP